MDTESMGALINEDLEKEMKDLSSLGVISLSQYQGYRVNQIAKHFGGGAAVLMKGEVEDGIKAAEKATNTNPTEAQKKSGKYKKGKTKVMGFPISIENPKGSTRSGEDDEGNKWSITMRNSYGFFDRTEGKDGDEIDLFLGDKPEDGKIYVVDQYHGDKFDEHKVMLGFRSKQAAHRAYLSNYAKGWKGMKAITEVPLDKFKVWLGNGTRRIKPVHTTKGMGAEAISSKG